MADTERLSVDIPGDVKRLLKSEAALAKVKMPDAVTDALRTWIAARQRERAQAAEVAEAFKARSGVTTPTT